MIKWNMSRAVTIFKVRVVVLYNAATYEVNKTIWQMVKTWYNQQDIINNLRRAAFNTLLVEAELMTHTTVIKFDSKAFSQKIHWSGVFL